MATTLALPSGLLTVGDRHNARESSSSGEAEQGGDEGIMAHICNYYCCGDVHAINLLLRSPLPFAQCTPEEQHTIQEQIFSDLRCIERDRWDYAVVRFIPVTECSTEEFYQANNDPRAPWSAQPSSHELECLLPYVVLVHYRLKEVPDAVS